MSNLQLSISETHGSFPITICTKNFIALTYTKKSIVFNNLIQ